MLSGAYWKVSTGEYGAAMRLQKVGYLFSWELVDLGLGGLLTRK